MSRRNDSPGVTGTLWAAAQEKGRPPEPPSQKASLPDRSSHRAATARPDPGLVFILSFYGTWHLLMRIKGSGHLLSVAEGQGHLIMRAVSDPVRLAERATEKVRDEPLGREPRSRPRGRRFRTHCFCLVSPCPRPSFFSSVDLSF